MLKLHTFRSTTVFIFAILSVIASSCAPASNTNQSQRLDELFRDLHERHLFDGAVLAGDAQHIFWQRGFGFADADKHVAFTTTTPTDGASLAKTFTAGLILALQDEGVVHLDQPAQRYLRELPYSEITLRHLLSHSSGLPVPDYDYFDPFIPAAQPRTTEALLKVIAAQRPRLQFPPGTAFEYSSFGYDLAALAAARAAGKTYGELLRERFFNPLGMTSAFLRPGRLADFPGIRTLGYRYIGEKLELNDVFDFEAFHGGSNIYISAQDLHRWNTSFITGSILKGNAFAQAHQFARISGGSSGLTLGSWYSSPNADAFWYAGHLQGFHSEVFRDTRSGSSIVYVSNNTLEPWLQHGIIRAVRRVLDGAVVESLKPPPTDEILKEQRGLLARQWMMPAGETIAIESSEDRLWMLRNDVRYPMFPVSNRAFYVPGLHFMVGFAKGPDGSFSRIHISSNLDEQWGVRQD